MKRISIVLALALALSLVFVGSAYANFGPHGGYVNDTDACAGCHRAHTSFSPITWTDSTLTPTNHSALLVGSAQTMTEFCNACHGDLAPGASTNVVSGVFDSGPSASSTGSVGVLGDTTGSDSGGVVAAYQTASTFNAPLNGGGFSRMPNPYVWESAATVAYKASTSSHVMDASGPLWGAGNAIAGNTMTLDCTSCHDPHGTSNFRLLKATPNPGGATVGGYESDGLTPNAFVFSDESGYPNPGVVVPGFGAINPNGGWLKHEQGAAQMGAYLPDYTKTDGTVIRHQDAAGNESLSVWCSACHVQYNVRTGAKGDPIGGPYTGYNYDPFEPVGSGTQVGAQVRHRHPVDITLGTNANPNPQIRTLTEVVASDPAWVPLEHNTTPSTFDQNWIGCLTCHRAHGSSVDMTGWAAAHLSQNASGTWVPVRDGVPGVDPAKGTSNLLRADNRGVCERCHNK